MMKMLDLPVKTYQDIMSLRPCFDPAKRGICTPDWTGTALDVLHATSVRPADRLWVVLSGEWLPEKIARFFSVWCINSAARALRADHCEQPLLLKIVEGYLNERIEECITDDEIKAVKQTTWYVIYQPSAREQVETLIHLLPKVDAV